MAGFPVVLELAADPITAKCNDGVGSTNGPEHSGVFEPPTDDGPTSGLDHTGTDEEFVGSELCVAHTFSIALEEVGFGVQQFSQCGAWSRKIAQRSEEH